MSSNHEHLLPEQGWPDPDMSVLNPRPPAAPQMTAEHLTLIYGEWAPWLGIAAAAKGSPVEYIAMALLAVASALIGNARWASPWPSWKEPSVLWVMLVGEPSSGKSPALDAVLEALRPIEQRLNEAYVTQHHNWSLAQELAEMRQNQWKSETKAALEDGLEPPPKPPQAEAPAKPVRARITIADATTEQVAVLMSNVWRGLLMTRDELSGWLGNMDRYTKGSGDQAFWLEAYGARPFTVDRKGSAEPLLIEHLSVSIIGGTQPEKLQSLLVRMDNDGLMARFLAVYPEAVPLSRPKQLIDTASLQTAFERLHALPVHQDAGGKSTLFVVPFSPTAADTFDEFREECRQLDGKAKGVIKGHIGKMPGLVVRLACVLAHLDWAGTTDPTPPQVINHCHVKRACVLVQDYLLPHAFRVYGGINLRGTNRVQLGWPDIFCRLNHSASQTGISNARGHAVSKPRNR